MDTLVGDERQFFRAAVDFLAFLLFAFFAMTASFDRRCVPPAVRFDLDGGMNDVEFFNETGMDLFKNVSLPAHKPVRENHMHRQRFRPRSGRGD